VLVLCTSRAETALYMDELNLRGVEAAPTEITCVPEGGVLCCGDFMLRLVVRRVLLYLWLLLRGEIGYSRRGVWGGGILLTDKFIVAEHHLIIFLAPILYLSKALTPTRCAHNTVQ